MKPRSVGAGSWWSSDFAEVAIAVPITGWAYVVRNCRVFSYLDGWVVRSPESKRPTR